MRILGVDPGLTGAHALLVDGLVAEIEPLPLAGGELDVKGIHERWGRWFPNIIVIERSQAFPKMGGSSAFNYGTTYGALKAIATCLGVRLELVGPAAWHKALLIGAPKSKDRTEIKAAVIRYCYRAFPRVELVRPGCRKPHDGMADSLCIAEFGRRTFGS